MGAMLQYSNGRTLRSVRRLAFIAALFSASTLRPQQASPPQSTTTATAPPVRVLPLGPQSSATPPSAALRATTHLVLVDVVVYDKQGNHVTNLTSADFTLRDRGKPQKISVFSNDRAGESPAENSLTPPLAPLPSGVFTNRPASNRPQGPPTILLLDSLNTALGDQLSSR